MSVTREEVRHIARLAELAISDAELPTLTAQLDRIVRFVAQLGDVGDLAGAEGYRGGPDHTPLREDIVGPGGLARPPSALAPEFAQGFFVVPRLSAMEDL